jgi:serine phosphatase RsbU (regulator of sigma subunit)
MSLRLRLIVSFFLLSVVPLAAVTLYTYRSNLDAVREAAGQEAEQLAGDLSRRMQSVTTQLSQRVERLMDLSDTGSSAPAPTTRPAASTPAASTAVPGATTGAAPAPPTATLPPEVAAALTESEQLAASLGDFAALLNNIEVRGLRGRGGRGGRGGSPNGPVGPPQSGTGRGPFIGPSPSGPPSAPGVPAAPAAPGTQGVPDPGGTGAAPNAPGAVSSPGAPGADPQLPQNGRRGGGSGRGSFGQGGSRDGQRDGGPGRGEPPNADPNRIRIDLNQIRRELFDELVSDRDAFDRLSPEERDKIFTQIDQRMQGIAQGIQVLQKELATRATDARTQEAAAAAALLSAVPATATPGPATSSTGQAPRAPAAPPAPVPPAAPAPVVTVATSQATTQRSTALSGSRLAVRVERDGEVVSEVGADINLPNLLAAVFATTSRERGEVPFAVAKDGTLHTPNDADRRTVEGLSADALSANTPPGTSLTGDWVVVTTADPTGLEAKFGVARPLGDAVSDLQRSAAVNAGFGFGLIVLALVGIVPLSSRLTRNLESLSEGVNRIAQGDYAARVQVKASDEVGRLAKAFNQMAADVEAHQRSMVERERIRHELELGRQIQHDMLPQVPLKLGLTEVRGVSVPAREVGGDFFNYFLLTNGTVALLVGDVSGKGVGAALLMANIQASLRTRLSLGQDLASLAQELDRDIESSTPGPVYATLFVGIFDPATRLLRCVNAGHNPQYVIRHGGGLERLESTGLPIGLLAGLGYTEQRVQLEAGDLLFFYTDGCVEAEDTSGEMFGMDRLDETLRASAGAVDVLTAVETEITRFRAGVELNDDATMMALRVG